MTGTEYALNLPMRGNITSGMERITSMPRVKAYRSTASTTTAGLHYITPFEAVEYDVDGMWSAVTPSRLTVKTAGMYLCTSAAQYNAAVNENVWTRILVNGAGPVASVTQYGMGGGFGTHQAPSGIWPCKAGDYIELSLFAANNNTGVFTGPNQWWLIACMISTLP